MEKFLQNTMLKLMRAPGHPLFDQSLSDIINEKDAPTPGPKQPSEEGKVTPPPNKKPKTETSGGDLQ
eukprot:218522-Pyramimonas_sp.AAC.1